MRYVSIIFCLALLVSCDKNKDSQESVGNGQSWLSGYWRGLLRWQGETPIIDESQTVDFLFDDSNGTFLFTSEDGGQASGLWYEDQGTSTLLFDIAESDTSLFGHSATQKNYQYILSGKTLKIQDERIALDLRRPVVEEIEPTKQTFGQQHHFHCFDYDANLVWVFNLKAPSPKVDIFRMTSSLPGYQENFSIRRQTDSLIVIDLQEHTPPLQAHLTPDSIALYQEDQDFPLRSFGCVAMADSH